MSDAQDATLGTPRAGDHRQTPQAAGREPLAGVGFGLRGKAGKALESRRAPNSSSRAPARVHGRKERTDVVSVNVANLRRLVRRFRTAVRPHGRAARRPLGSLEHPRRRPRRRFPGAQRRQLAGCLEIYAFAPGIDPKSIDVSVEKGLLVDLRRTPGAGRQGLSAKAGDERTVYANERFSGRFRRVVALPEDADPGGSRPATATAC